MSGWLQGTFLRSVVARRVAALFFLSAFVPVVVLALLTYRQVGDLLVKSAETQLQQETQLQARALYQRLIGARFLLAAEVSRQHHLADAAASEGLAGFARVFRQLRRSTLSELEAEQPGRSQADPLTSSPAAVRTRLDADTAVLVTRIVPGQARPEVWLAQAFDTARTTVLWAEIAPSYLWGDKDELPRDTEVCVMTAQRQVLNCSDDTLAAKAVQIAGLDTTVDSGRNDGLLAGRHVLFLKASFVQDDWSVVALRPRSLATEPLARLSQSLAWLIVLTLLLVALLSVVQIRRTMVPLERLIAGTRRFAREQFDQPVVVDSNDEFGRLAQSLNHMARRLGQQIGAMQVLASIDQQILSHLDVEKIIERVQCSVLDLFAQARVGVLIASADAASGATSDARLYLREASDAQTRYQQVSAQGLDPIADARLREGVWLPAGDAVVPREFLQDAGLTIDHCFVLPLAVHGRSVGMLAVGVAGAAIDDAQKLAQVRDLGARVGVALATHQHEQRLVYLAHYDGLTGLPNREFFEERLQHELSRSRRGSQQLAVLFVDLDRFKDINDTQGHEVGDEVLIEVAQRLKSKVRDSDIVARLGGDEFVVVQTGLHSARSAGTLAELLVDELAQPFQTRGQENFVGASVGIAMFPDDGDTVQVLLKQADIAMYRAKASGRSCVVFFEESMNTELHQRNRLQQELRQAIARNQLSVHYQPRVRLSDGKVVGAEALLRWWHPELGQVSPAQFIPLAEEVGLIDEIGPWVLRQVCQQLQQWTQAGFDVGTVAVNASGRQFRNDDLVKQVRGLLSDFQLSSLQLEIEVTESILIDDVQRVVELLAQFKRLGVCVALDDFGTGYSSMTYLRRLPIDVLKIDQSFVRELCKDDSARSIVQAIIALAHALGKTLVAEGVETPEQAQALHAMGCEEAQGFLYSRAVPAPEFEKMLIKRI